MAYLEELLPEFRKGAKIRCTAWEPHCFVYCKNGVVYDQNQQVMPRLTFPHVVSDNWELYQEPEPDWDYIIKNKCLCWFWDEGEKGNKIAGILRRIKKDSPIPFITDTGEYDYTTGYANCRPVRRDELIFYEDKKDE